MIQLSNSEVAQIGGGVTVTLSNCYTKEYLHLLHEDAQSEATKAMFFVSALGGGGTYTLATTLFGATPLGGFIATTYVMAVLAPYSYNEAYNSFELWPWNQ